MQIKSEVELFVRDKFYFLENELKLSKPLINNDGWKTKFDYLGEELAIEVEVDWRDLDIFVLIVRLDNGKLPGGYYISGGKKVRVHIEKILNQEFGVNSNEIKAMFKENKQKELKNKECLEGKIIKYQNLLSKFGEKILEKGAIIFDP